MPITSKPRGLGIHNTVTGMNSRDDPPGVKYILRDPPAVIRGITKGTPWANVHGRKKGGELQPLGWPLPSMVAWARSMPSGSLSTVDAIFLIKDAIACG